MFSSCSVLVLVLVSEVLVHVLCAHAGNINTCLNVTHSAVPRPKQIVFVHIYKTGGSTMREVFREYGQKCGYTTAVIVHCKKDATLDAAAVTDSTVLPCQIKSFTSNGNELQVRPQAGLVRKRGTLAFTRQFDIIVGHLPHGLFKFVSEMRAEAPAAGAGTVAMAVREPRERLLVTWLRHPLSMLISSCLYLINKNQGERSLVRTSYAEVLQKMRVKMERAENVVASSGAYSQFVKYLLPGGLAAASKMGEEAVLAFVGAHLQEYAVIGILEQHRRSLQMLKRTVDPELSLQDKWWTNISGMKRNAVTAGSKAAKTKGKGKGKGGKRGKGDKGKGKDAEGGGEGGEEDGEARGGRALQEGTEAEAEAPVQVISTDSLKAYIEANATLNADITHVLRLEYRIYEMALAVHQRQCAALAADYPEIQCGGAP